MKLKNTKVKNFSNNKVIPQDLTTINWFYFPYCVYLSSKIYLIPSKYSKYSNYSNNAIATMISRNKTITIHFSRSLVIQMNQMIAYQ